MSALPVDENTMGREAARRALIESRRSSRRADTVIEKSQAAIAQLAEAHAGRDYFAERLRETIRGKIA